MFEVQDMTFIPLLPCYYPAPKNFVALHFAYVRKVFCVDAQTSLRGRVRLIPPDSFPVTSPLTPCYIGICTDLEPSIQQRRLSINDEAIRQK